MQKRTKLVLFIWGSVIGTIVVLAALLFMAKYLRSRANPPQLSQMIELTFIKHNDQLLQLKKT